MIDLKFLTVALTAMLVTGQPITSAFDPLEKTIPEIRAAIDSGGITCTQLVQWYLDRIEAYDRNGPRLNSVRVVNPKALQIAAEYEKVHNGGGAKGPLFCIPLLLKDNINTLDLPTTAGSVALKDSTPPDDAFLVKRLKAAGAIILGKVNLTEFAAYLSTMMPSGYSSLAGFVYNPYDPRPQPESDGRPALVSPGTSSAGSAVAASANLASATIGTETSISIINPSNLNALVGLKPTIGLISREGMIPLAFSQDTPGPIARNVTDAAMLLGVMAGVDPKDPATAASEGKSLTDYIPSLSAGSLSGMRIGVPRATYWNGLNPERRNIAERALEVLRKLGATIIDVEIKTAAAIPPAFSSFVLRYEFKRDLNEYLGTLGPNAPIKTLANLIAYNEQHSEVALKYGQDLALASEAVDLQADRQRYLAARAEDIRLAKVDGLDATFDADFLTAIFFPGVQGADIGARAGYPSIIVPAGTLSNGTPFGIALLGRAFSEPALLSLAYAFEQATKVRRSPSTTLAILPISTEINPVMVRNAASGAVGRVAPGEIVLVSGSGVGPAIPTSLQFTSDGRLETMIATTRLLFDGVPAPLISVRSDQIRSSLSFRMPWQERPVHLCMSNIKESVLAHSGWKLPRRLQGSSLSNVEARAQRSYSIRTEPGTAVKTVPRKARSSLFM
jgi:amidase